MGELHIQIINSLSDCILHTTSGRYSRNCRENKTRRQNEGKVDALRSFIEN